MTTVVEWKQVPNPTVVVRYAIKALNAGRMLVMPSESGYQLVTSALAPTTLTQAKALGLERTDPILAVLDAPQTRDWIPQMPTLGVRVGRRFWPGPLTIRFRSGFEAGIHGKLPNKVKAELDSEGFLQFRSPDHPCLRRVLEQFSHPLAMFPLGEASPEDQRRADPMTNLSRVSALTDLLVLDGLPRHPEGDSVLEIGDEGWELLREGAIPRATIQEQLACLIVFLCTGNTCRSPLAEALCKHRLAQSLQCTVEELPDRGYSVQSAGLAAMAGGPAAHEANEVARSLGADLSQHRSQPVTEELVTQADYLIAMTRNHVQALEDHFTHLPTRPRLLLSTGENLPDPIGQPLDVYRECARVIWQALDSLLAELNVPTKTTDNLDQVDS